MVDTLELAHDEMSSYVNKRTGTILPLSHKVMRLAEKDSEEDLPDWQAEELALAKDVLESTDWLELPSKFEVHEWKIMDRFAQTLSSPAQREEVLNAIHGRGAFRAFKNTVRRLLLEDAWFAFKASAFEEVARSWLTENGFEIDETAHRGSPQSHSGAAFNLSGSNQAKVPADDLDDLLDHDSRVRRHVMVWQLRHHLDRTRRRFQRDEPVSMLGGRQIRKNTW